jgi:hypothetical protein
MTTISSPSPSRSHRRRASKWLLLASVAAACVLASAAAAQESFASPDAATAALVDAARNGNRAGVLSIFGPNSKDVVDSGDPVADATMRQRFLDAFDESHQIAMDGDSRAIIIIGGDGFPFPIPLVRTGDKWHFDIAAGRREILYRRVGRNELDTIQASLAYVDAQDEYAEKDRTGAGPGTYAQRIVSNPGKKDGLYWPAKSSDDQSPLGELVAGATTDGYKIGGERAPFHGYYYKILTKQGPAAPGGALDYVVRGKMIGGFGLVAYPAQYGNSGVMTFIVNHNGTVYQKDLGPRTAEFAEHMASFDPDDTWKKVDTSAM